MARTEGDSWDLASSVGATATMVAAQRALSNREGLIDDPFAEPLVRAVGMDFFVRALDGEIELGDVDPEFNMRRAAEGMDAGWRTAGDVGLAHVTQRDDRVMRGDERSEDRRQEQDRQDDQANDRRALAEDVADRVAAQ